MRSVDLKTSLFRGNIYRSLDIASSGMTAQRKRMDAIASNIANVSVTRTENGGPYLRRQVLMSPDPKQTFADTLKRVALDMDNTSAAHIEETRTMARGTESIPLVKGSESEVPNVKKNVVSDPAHPDADADGYVTYPDVNIIEEMVDLMVASRAFEANVTVVNAAKSMITKSLEI
ncbi:MAG: flagellar basal body rod protein FlgC [Candidatus Latescibacterota bacterium]